MIRKSEYDLQKDFNGLETDVSDLTDEVADLTEEVAGKASINDNGATSVDSTYSASKIEERLTEVSGVEEAPIDGNQYARKDAGWEEVAVGSYLTSANIDDTAYNATSWNGVTTNAPSKNAVRDKIESLTAEIPSVIYSTDNPYSWSVSGTQYISIVVTGVLVIDGSSAGTIDCSIQLQHSGVGLLTSITVGFRNSVDTDRIPFALTYVAVGSGWEGNDFSVVEGTYGSTIEEVNWNFNYRL